MTKKYIVPLLLLLLVLPLVASAQSELFSGKISVDFTTKTQPALLKQAADPATTPYDFMILCKRLGVYGDKVAAAVVAKSLDNPARSHSARTALEEMPFPEALAELRNAVANVKDPVLKAGIIGSLGMRQDREAVGMLLPLVKNENSTIAIAAVFALARIGDPSYQKDLLAKLGNKDAFLAKTYADLNLMYGEFLRVGGGHVADAEKVFFTVAEKAPSDFHKEAAYYQILLANNDRTAKWAAEWLIGKDCLKYRATLRAAQFVKNDAMTNALVAAYDKVSDEKKPAILAGLGDQRNMKGQAILLAALNSDNETIKGAAVNAMKVFANRAYFSDIVKAAVQGDDALRKSSITVIEMLDDDVNVDILKLLKGSDGEKAFGAELVGTRKITAGRDDLFALAKSAAVPVRIAAVKALGNVADAKQLQWLVNAIVKPESPVLADAAKTGLKNACGLYQDRAEAAKIIADASQKVKGKKADRLYFFQMLSVLGGPVARDTVEKAAYADDQESRDLATQVLGGWMDPDVAPILLKLANAKGYQYGNRALRGYLRLARQFAMPIWMRRAMVRDALASPACSAKEKEIADVIIKQYKLDLKVAETAYQKALRNIEVQKVVYGLPDDPAKSKDVTDQVRDIIFNADSLTSTIEGGYNKAFGGDPAPGIPKVLRLTLRYRDSGKQVSIEVRENAKISLPEKP